MSGSDRRWFDPDYCQPRCPVCTRAWKGNRLARLVQRIEMVVTFGGCPWGRARQRKYGVRPDEPLPDRQTGADRSAGDVAGTGVRNCCAAGGHQTRAQALRGRPGWPWVIGWRTCKVRPFRQ